MTRRLRPQRCVPLMQLLFLVACGQENNAPSTHVVEPGSSSTNGPLTTAAVTQTATTEQSNLTTATTAGHTVTSAGQSATTSLPSSAHNQATDTATSALQGNTEVTFTSSSDQATSEQTSTDDLDTSSTPSATVTDSSPSSSQEPNLPPLQPTSAAITFGTTLDAASVMTAARELARSLVNPDAIQWRAKGDQHRTYRFAETNTEEPYRLYVPSTWDGQSKLPLVLFLHGAGSDENTYVDQNDKQLISLAEEHGFILVSPLGSDGAYGNFLRLSAPFGNPEAASQLMAEVTPESRQANEISEKDVINVLELVLAEYPVDLTSIYITGHSMGSGGTWYIGGKYSTYFRAIAPMSGPFVQEQGYPWDNLLDMGIFVTEGTQTPSLDASRLLGSWLAERDFDAVYEEVNADHGAMVPLVLPNVFAFFSSRREP